MDTLNAYMKHWIATQSTQLEPATLLSYRGLIGRYIEPALGRRPLDGLDAPSLDRFYVDLLRGGGLGGRPLSLRTVRYCHSVLHKALSDAVRSGVLDKNAADQATLPRIDPRADATEPPLRVWTGPELRSFLEWSEERRFGALWRVAAGTGLRRGELAGLRRGDVDLEGRLLHVRRAVSAVQGVRRVKLPKSGRPRALSLDAVTVQALRTLTDRSSSTDGFLVVGEDGGPIDPMILSVAFRRDVSRAPIPRIRLHDLRHTHATLMLAAGVPVKVVSARLGHASVRLTLDVYAHILPSMDEGAAEQFSAHVWG